MSDITKCGGFECPMKEACKRYTTKSKKIMESYFLDPPYHINEGGFSCDMYLSAKINGIRIPNLNYAVDNINNQFGSDER